MALDEDLKKTVAEIFKSRWTTRDGTMVPEPENVGLGNDAVRLEAAILYADLRGSTNMVNTKTREFAGEVYKSYLHCAGKIIQNEGGVITAYDGDRIMAVFLGNLKRTNAAGCALKIHWAVHKVINPSIVTQYGSDAYTVKHIVGVDVSDVFVARTGVWGNNDLVWVGPAANYAAKLCELGTGGHSSYITHRVFDDMADTYKTWNGKNVWEERAWTEMNKMRIYRSAWTWTL